MPVPHVSGNFGDVLDPRFQSIFDKEFDQHADMIPELFTMVSSNGRNEMKWSDIGTLPDFESFGGTVSYQSQHQGYDTTATPQEFASGIQIERKLFDDDQYGTMDGQPRALAASAARTRQKHGARIFNNSTTTTDSLGFWSQSEGVALCSDSHTTNSNASTASGFDNLVTTALSAVAVAAARIQMRGFRGDQAERIDVIPDELWIPTDLFEEAREIVGSMGKLDTANNNINVHEGQYRVHEWVYLNDTNNWWMTDSSLRRQELFWTDRIPLEFAMVEDFDTFTAKWRAYMRYAHAHVNWRWVLGASVS